jgi:hypothetical protein
MVITVFCKLSVFCQIVVRFGDWRRASSAVKADTLAGKTDLRRARAVQSSMAKDAGESPGCAGK